MNKKVVGLLGLARRAGHIVFGSQALIPQNALKIALVLVANDVSPRTKNIVTTYCEKYHKKLIVALPISELSMILSAHHVGVLAITDRRLAAQIEEKMKEGDPYGQKEEILSPEKE
ncbi:MAG: L7Ae/L30e/S12e/Gadd45 family ribosomal protein [Bacilli bacterium]